MKELEKLVEKLEDKNSKEEERVKILQDIGKALIIKTNLLIAIRTWMISKKTDLDNYIFIIKVMADLTYAFQIPMNFTYRFC